MPPKVLASGSIQRPYLDETYVYRAYCICDDLLYVGMTNDVFTRLDQHRRLAVWYSRVDRVEWEIYKTRELAAKVEAQMIRRLNPRYNTAGTRTHPNWQSLPWPRFLTEDDQQWQAVDIFHGKPPLDRLFASDAWGRPA